MKSHFLTLLVTLALASVGTAVCDFQICVRGCAPAPASREASSCGADGIQRCQCGPTERRDG
ncbi:hypothetical protein HYFRA_00012428 [Hymenoscyphus fraxineus]|uniref:Uncharacterized protein n=1 Tax=Hymenoscyphus fraxineus TaxID=746836 RepID=A0A9N9L765_9HELO|nr:hypothetical protein HYFRA_00012428 [Hymenoscyphus fraxineus]